MPHKSSVHLAACIGYTSNVTNHRLPIESRPSSRSAKSNSNNFYENENYHLILDCLDEGYRVSIDLLEYLQDYNGLLKKHIDNLTEYSKKWSSKIENQLPISSYHTTKSVQLSVVSQPAEECKALLNRYVSIEEIINKYRLQLDNIYPRERFSTSHKHYRRKDMKQLFKAAHSSLSNVLRKLTDLREQEQRILNNLDTTSESSESDVEITKRLKEIRELITHVEKEHHKEKQIYRSRAYDIYKQCRILEKQRLDLVKETLIKFIEVAYSSEHATQQRQIYDTLKTSLNVEQNTIADLDFWATKYRVYDSTSSKINRKHHDNDCDSISSRRERMSSNNQNSNGKKQRNIQSSMSEDDEQQSITDTMTPSFESKDKQTTVSV